MTGSIFWDLLIPVLCLLVVACLIDWERGK